MSAINLGIRVTVRVKVVLELVLHNGHGMTKQKLKTKSQ